MFQSSLEAMLNNKHPLCKLTNAIGWKRIEGELSSCYSTDSGRLIRDIGRKMIDCNDELSAMLDRARLIHPQQLKDKAKLYSLDTPEVDSRFFYALIKTTRFFQSGIFKIQLQVPEPYLIPAD